jgi:hypothetical protein
MTGRAAASAGARAFASFRIIAADFLPIMIVGALVFPPTTTDMMRAFATRSLGSTTLFPQELLGCWFDTPVRRT